MSASWLWPDHVIGKRESRRLREEHNETVNAGAGLADALREVAESFEDAVRMAGHHPSANTVCIKARAALAAWDKVKS